MRLAVLYEDASENPIPALADGHGADELVDGLDHMHRYTDRAGPVAMARVMA